MLWLSRHASQRWTFVHTAFDASCKWTQCMKPTPQRFMSPASHFNVPKTKKPGPNLYVLSLFQNLDLRYHQWEDCRISAISKPPLALVMISKSRRSAPCVREKRRISLMENEKSI